MQNILWFPRSSENREKIAFRTTLFDKCGFSIRVTDTNVKTAEEVAELLTFWRPAGCIVNNDRLPTAAFARCPTVFLHRAPETKNRRHATIGFDEKAVAETAAHHLLSLNLISYAYVPPHTDEQWSREREEHFVHILGLNGYGVASYNYPKGRLSTPKQLTHLGNWLADLPHPVGVFAANDATGVNIITACGHRGLSIPKDITVIGVDNDEVICEALRPTLSSIATDDLTLQTECLRIITQFFSNNAQVCRNVTVKPLGVVRRASTLRRDKNDPAVVAACDLIRRRACEGLKARDVAATFPCGRRMAEIRFRAMLGHSILDEIRAVRRARAQIETSPGRTKLRDEIAFLCGYSSWSSVYRLLAEDRDKADKGQIS